MSEHINLTELIDKALGTLTMTANTYAYLISRIGVTIVNRNEHVIAYTDGKGIYFNQFEFDFLYEKGEIQGVDCKLNKENLIFIMCHELMHLLTETFARGKALGICSASDHRLWNEASDYEINWLLHNNRDNEGKSVPLGKMPAIGLYDDKYANMTAEEIYEILKRENQNDKGAGNNSEGNDGDGSSYDNDDSNNDNVDGNSLSDHCLDKHMPIDEMTANEIKAQVEEVLKQTQLQGYGDTVLNRINSILFKPVKFDWKRALSKYFKNYLKGNYTWNKPARSGVATGLRLPSIDNVQKLRVGVALDTSGSISDHMLQKLMQHIFTILTQVKQYEVYVWCVSTKPHPETLTKYTPSNKNTVKKFVFASDCGTDLRTTFPFIEKEFASKPLDTLIYMTDGYDSLSGDNDVTVPYPIVWLIIDNDGFKKPARIKGEVYPINDR